MCVCFLRRSEQRLELSGESSHLKIRSWGFGCARRSYTSKPATSFPACGNHVFSYPCHVQLQHFRCSDVCRLSFRQDPPSTPRGGPSFALEDTETSSFSPSARCCQCPRWPRSAILSQFICTATNKSPPTGGFLWPSHLKTTELSWGGNPAEATQTQI